VDFAGIPDLRRVLDIGSGIGTLTFETANRAARTHVIGIDPSKEFVGFAMSRQHARGTSADRTLKPEIARQPQNPADLAHSWID